MPPIQRFPPARQVLYALGTAGWTITDRVVVTFALFFYLPPAGLGLPSRLEDRAVLGMTMFGALMIFGRIVDSVSDPLVALWSDRSRSRLGRRRVFMLAGAIPLAIVTAVLFLPPTDEPSTANAVFLAVVLAAFFLLFTVYVTPYLALIPELARDVTERIHLTTQQAYAQLAGAGLVLIGTPMLVGVWGASAAAYQSAIAATCVVAAILMLLPVLVVDEGRYTEPIAGTQPGLRESLQLTFANRPFAYYLGGNIAYWFAFNTLSSSALYLTTVLMRADAAFQSTALAATFGVAGVFFWVWNVFARRYGKRKAILAAGAAFVVALVATALVRDRGSGVLVFALFGLPVSALLVLPNAMLADCADADARRTGSRREAMYFGAQGFLLKVNLGISTAVLAGLMAVFGKDVGNDLGLRLAGPCAAVVVLLGMWSFWKYPEEPTGSSGDR